MPRTPRLEDFRDDEDKPEPPARPVEDRELPEGEET